MKLSNTIKNTLLALPIVAAGILSSQNVQGQEIPYRPMPPKGNINLFKSQDNTPNAQAYNNAKTKTQRDSIIAVRLAEDWVNTIQGRITPTVWNCNQYTRQLEVNSRDLGKGIIYGNKPLYNNYDGFDLEQIYTNKGTIKDMGKLGLPMQSIGIHDPITQPSGHSENFVVTGDKITISTNPSTPKIGDKIDLESVCIIEPQRDATYIKPGDKRSYIPENAELIEIIYTYSYKDKNGYTYIDGIPIIKAKAVNGDMILTYLINYDTSLQYNRDNYYNDPREFIPKNELIHLIMTRKEAENHAPTTFEYVTPKNNETITFNNQNLLEIKTTTPTDQDKDQLTKKIRVTGAGLDTLIITPAEITTAYINYKKFKPETEYKISGEVTDQIATTTVQEITIKAPKYTANKTVTEYSTKIYPNPATDIINIEIPLSTVVNTKVYSIEGKLWFEKSSDSNQSISVDVLPPGIYFIKTATGSYTYIGKFIKQ